MTKNKNRFMGNPFFRFKQFTVWHDHCAMKVGTDGVLLGAWTKLDGARRVLDIGTGSGLIALMAAQRCTTAQVTGIDIDPEAVKQAQANAKLSPWADRIRIRVEDAGTMKAETSYDAIVSNPPYFARHAHCPDTQRDVARHTGTLDFDTLLDTVERLLADNGTFSVILPTEAGDKFVALAAGRHLYPSRRTWVQSKPLQPPKRVLMAFVRNICPCEESRLLIKDASDTYSAEFAAMAKDFYLAL